MLDIKADDQVHHQIYGAGVVFELVSETAAVVDFETEGRLTVSTDGHHKLSLINNHPPQQIGYTRSKSKHRGISYITDYDRAIRPWILGWSQQTAWIVGFLASKNAYLRHSGQFNKETKILTESFEEASSASHGEKFDVIVENPNYVGLDDLLDINFIQRSNTASVSLNKQGFFEFLLGLGFRDGRGQEQDSKVIRQNVPDEYLDSFDGGVAGVISN